jgi:aspartate carbamoyltransferase catalytic subunit
VLNFDASTSSTRKGETARDTAQPRSDGRARLHHAPSRGWRGGALAEAAGEGTALINAGDGRSAHPTQGLLDMLTLRQAKGSDFSKLSVLIVGDVKHSRVARSDLHALRTLGIGRIRVCGPAIAAAG